MIKLTPNFYFIIINVKIVRKIRTWYWANTDECDL